MVSKGGVMMVDRTFVLMIFLVLAIALLFGGAGTTGYDVVKRGKECDPSRIDTVCRVDRIDRCGTDGMFYPDSFKSEFLADNADIGINRGRVRCEQVTLNGITMAYWRVHSLGSAPNLIR